MFSKFIKWLIVLFIIWVAVTNAFNIQSIVAGLIISAFISAVFVGIFERKLNANTNDTTAKAGNPIRAIIYLLVFIKNLIKSNIDIMKRVLNPKLPINPGIVEVSTKADTDLRKLIVANSITLTPGTITLDIVDDKMYVHWIDVTTDDKEKAGELIKGDFEKYI